MCDEWEFILISVSVVEVLGRSLGEGFLVFVYDFWWLLLLIVVLLIVGFVLWRSSFVLKVRVNSKREFNSFDPYAHFSSLSLRDFKKLEKAVSDSSGKKRVIVEWSFIDSRDVKLVDSVKFSVSEVKPLVEALSVQSSVGKTKIDTLNKAYAIALSKNKELKDDVPRIYCYEILNSKDHEGLVKVGFASKSALDRVARQVKTAAHVTVEYEVLFIMPALTVSDREFKDYEVHKVLRKFGVRNPMGEWFACDESTARKAVEQVQYNLS